MCVMCNHIATSIGLLMFAGKESGRLCMQSSGNQFSQPFYPHTYSSLLSFNVITRAIKIINLCTNNLQWVRAIDWLYTKYSTFLKWGFELQWLAWEIHVMRRIVCLHKYLSLNILWYRHLECTVWQSSYLDCMIGHYFPVQLNTRLAWFGLLLWACFHISASDPTTSVVKSNNLHMTIPWLLYPIPCVCVWGGGGQDNSQVPLYKYTRIHTAPLPTQT